MRQIVKSWQLLVMAAFLVVSDDGSCGNSAAPIADARRQHELLPLSLHRPALMVQKDPMVPGWSVSGEVISQAMGSSFKF
jgi:hypothetical protein